MATVQRPDKRPPVLAADEKATLVHFLEYLRESFTYKLAGLSDDEARRQLVPSGTSLLGLAKHLAGVELGWFCSTFAGEDVNADRTLKPEETLASVLDQYKSACARANEVIVACEDMSQPCARVRPDGQQPTFRWILTHIVEETARHAGHADILREQIDGQVGR